MESLREIEEKKLKAFIENPGFFPVLISGENGTGKEYILKKVLAEKAFAVYQPFEIGNNETEMSRIFENEIILVKNIDELTPGQQDILWKALSTIDGRIGLGLNRGFKRIIFTTTYDLVTLRENSEFQPRLWDRISQLVIRMPSFKESSNVLKDFESVWTKMDFKTYNNKPNDGEFKYWLKDKCGTFAGNFRDLDKIAILWHQYRIIEYPVISEKKGFTPDSKVEAKIFTKVRNDFERYCHFPTQKADTSNIFEFEKGKTWSQINREFKSKFKNWAKAEYHTIKDATDALNMPLRKMDKW
jgi:transcriptional regulator of aromatic amino acid metabolism